MTKILELGVLTSSGFEPVIGNTDRCTLSHRHTPSLCWPRCSSRCRPTAPGCCSPGRPARSTWLRCNMGLAVQVRISFVDLDPYCRWIRVLFAKVGSVQGMDRISGHPIYGHQIFGLGRILICIDRILKDQICGTSLSWSGLKVTWRFFTPSGTNKKNSLGVQ